MPDFPLQEPFAPEFPLETPEYTLLTAEEVATILRVPRSWVYSHLDLLPVIRLGRYVRFSRSGIERLTGASDRIDRVGPCA